MERSGGHADQNGLFAWVAHFQKRPHQIFLVHGEEESKTVFAALIHDKLGYDPIAVMGNSSLLTAEGMLNKLSGSMEGCARYAETLGRAVQDAAERFRQAESALASGMDF